MKKLLIVMTVFVSIGCVFATEKFEFIAPNEVATGCEYKVYFQPENGDKFKSLSYDNHPIKYAKTTLQECINAGLTTQSFGRSGYSVMIQHGSLGDTSLEIIIHSK